MKKILLGEKRKRPVVDPSAKKIYALVDDADYEYLKQWAWQPLKTKRTCYATRRMVLSSGKSTTIYMHRQILGLPESETLCDHKDHNGLNNQKGNIRGCSFAQNSANRRPNNGSSSKYVGVTLTIDKRRGYRYWNARVIRKGVSLFHASFPGTRRGEILAAKAYDQAAKIHHGEFANLNFKQK